jgi:RNA polymerase sigma factor (sigma-70 family)
MLPVVVDPEAPSAGIDPLDVIRVHEALEALAALDARQAAIVEARYFAGLTIEETAEALNLSPATVKREWSAARLFLLKAMKDRART